MTRADVAPGPVLTGDADLVVRARGGDREAAGELVARHRGAAYKLAFHLLGSREDALDVAQEALLRFFSTLNRFDLSRPVRPWLLRIVHNLARDLRRRDRVWRMEPLEQVAAYTPDQTENKNDPSALVETRDLRRRVWHVVHALEPIYREILVLRDYEDLSYAEIAVVLHVPIGTVMSRLHRARVMVREALPGAAPAGREGGCR